MAGRPRKHVDPQLVTRLAAYGMSLEELASTLDVSTNFLRRRYPEQLAAGRRKLKRTVWGLQVRAARQGNTGMLVWLGRTILGQSVKRPVTLEDLAIETQLEAELAQEEQQGEDSTAQGTGEVG